MKHSSQNNNEGDKGKQDEKNANKVFFENTELINELAKVKWGKDILSGRLDDAFYNIGVSFLELKPYFDNLIRATEIFNDVLKLLSHSDFKGFVSMSLFARAYSCFVGAVRLSCSGQVTETWVLLRACIENSLYAFYIAGNPEYATIWAERGESEDHKKNCRKVFAIGNIWKVLGEKSPSLTKAVKDYYDDTIDWGAHPNERSLFSNLEKKQDGSGLMLNIFNPSETLMRHGLCAILSNVSLVFKIFALIYPDEFKQPNLSIKIGNLNNQTRILYRMAIECSKAEDEVKKRKAR
jgi:hypothetical protein